MRICFFGTSAFALPALELLRASSHTVVGVVTQPDRPAGRGRAVTPSPVAAFAHTQGLLLLQPPSLKEPTALEQIRAIAPDCIAVVAYGKFLPPELLALPPQRCVNVHPSLLPKYRGTAPINWAILNGDTVTGVSTMYMSAAMDAGDLLLQREVGILPDEDAAELSMRLAPIGAELLIDTLDGIADGRAKATPQDPARVVLAPAFTKADGRLDWRKSARQICNQVRGLQPWPNAYTMLNGQQLTIFRSEVLGEPTDAAPGTIVNVTRAIHVATGDHRQLCLTEVQLAGKRQMSSQDFLRGHPIAIRTILGDVSPSGTT